MISPSETLPRAGSTTWKPSDAQRKLLEALSSQVKLEKSAAEFTRLYCPFGPSKLSKILEVLKPDGGPSYFDEIADPDGELESIEMLLSEIKLQRAQRLRVEGLEIHELSHFRAVCQGLRECKNKTNPERIVLYLAPTGGAKTMLCNHSVEKLGARIVEVRDSWKKSRYIVLQDMARAVGLRLDRKKAHFPAYIEDRLVEAGNERSIILALDEGETFGTPSLNVIKYLTNRARFTFLICCIPEAFDRWTDLYPLEADQVLRRLHARVELAALKPDDAAKFFTVGTTSTSSFEEPTESLAAICESASTFGHYSLVQRVATQLQGLKKAGLDDVKKAIAAARRQMLRKS